MEERKRWRAVFTAEGFRRKVIYIHCTEDELQGEKEKWAVMLENDTGLPWRCESITEADNIRGKKGGRA